MKARDLIAKLMMRDLDLDVFVGVHLVQEGDGPCDVVGVEVPCGDVEWHNDGPEHKSPRLVIHCPEEVVVQMSYNFVVQNKS